MFEKLLRLPATILRGICLDAPVKCRMHRKHIYDDSIAALLYERREVPAQIIDFIIKMHPRVVTIVRLHRSLARNRQQTEKFQTPILTVLQHLFLCRKPHRRLLITDVHVRDCLSEPTLRSSRPVEPLNHATQRSLSSCLTHSTSSSHEVTIPGIHVMWSF